jgi:hypothetical protein
LYTLKIRERKEVSNGSEFTFFTHWGAKKKALSHASNYACFCLNDYQNKHYCTEKHYYFIYNEYSLHFVLSPLFFLIGSWVAFILFVVLAILRP